MRSCSPRTCLLIISSIPSSSSPSSEEATDESSEDVEAEEEDAVFLRDSVTNEDPLHAEEEEEAGCVYS